MFEMTQKPSLEDQALQNLNKRGPAWRRSRKFCMHQNERSATALNKYVVVVVGL